ncbi:MAG TPA: hypothetical protein VHG51_00300 [Longimicrobiaceae bacterium]|nr:hypothetical protein [Longimicrobiaceae bacterium]
MTAPPLSPRAVRRAGAAALAAALAACGGRSPGLPEGPPLVRGPVESIVARATGTGIRVGPGPGSREACGIAAVADAGTRYLRRTDPGGLRPAALADLQVGDTVEVYVDGPVAESCPVQGRAAAVVLVARPVP